MGTSNWQNISWCVQAIMQIEPRRVLDIGVGFGRWGMVLREFGEVWFDRITPDDWSIRVEGIEAYPKNLADYHEHFYDEIHVGDASEILETLDADWDLVILGDVIEHFYKSEGERILDYCIANSKYVLVNLPLGEDWPQQDKYENPYEEHKAVWDFDDFEGRPLVAARSFLDFEERRFGCAILSSEDPCKLGTGLFGSPRQGELRQAGESGPSLATDGSAISTPPLLKAVEEKLGAVDAIRTSRVWKLLNRVRNHPLLWSSASILPGDRGERIVVRHLGRKTEGGPPGELRLLRVESDGEPVLWDFISQRGGWDTRPSPAGAFGELLSTTDSAGLCRWFSYGGRMSIAFQAHPGGGLCEIRVGRRAYTVNLEQPAECTALFDCKKGELQIVGARATRHARAAPENLELSREDRRLLTELQTQQTSSLAIYVPEWTGITNSTLNLFPVCRGLAAELDSASRDRFLHFVEEAKPANLIVSGGALEHLHLCPEIRQRSPETRIKLLWHGSFLQVREDYAWQGMRLAFDLARREVIHTLGFVKEGMAETVSDMDLPSGFVMNYVAEIPDAASTPAEGGPHLGLWISNEGWRKLPYAMAAAVRRIPDAILHYSGRRKRLVEFSRLIGLNAHQHGDTLLDAHQLSNWMRRMHCNLYVTLSECAPMLPLESLSVGTPCLLGPNSHLFRDAAELHRLLVVPVPDSADCIYERACEAIDARDEIVRAYAGWAEAYNQRARDSVRVFLEL